jgi:hypothetical protein
MSNSLKTQAGSALKVAISFAPWVLSAYTLYWLETGNIWTTETAHRGKISVAILALGMGLSFLTRSYFANRQQK